MLKTAFYFSNYKVLKSFSQCSKLDSQFCQVSPVFYSIPQNRKCHQNPAIRTDTPQIHFHKHLYADHRRLQGIHLPSKDFLWYFPVSSQLRP